MLELCLAYVRRGAGVNAELVVAAIARVCKQRLLSAVVKLVRSITIKDSFCMTNPKSYCEFSEFGISLDDRVSGLGVEV